MPLVSYRDESPGQSMVVTASSRQTLLEVSRQAKIPHVEACGGHARCSTCRVRIVEGLEHCSTPTADEQELRQRLKFPGDMRLACQTRPLGDVVVCRLVRDAEDLDLAANQVQQGTVGEEKEVAILFADIRGFTRFAESVPAYDTIYVLNRYFRTAGEAMAAFDGTISNYMGDGFMALFGVRNPDRSAERAVRAALSLLRRVEHLNQELTLLAGSPLRIGIGIHYGRAVLGGVGAHGDQRMTAIGDSVNLASRIEAVNKTLGTSLLVSEIVYGLVREQVTVGCQSETGIPGKTGAYRLYEITNIDDTYVPTPVRPTRRLGPWHWLRRWGQRLWQWLVGLLRV